MSWKHDKVRRTLDRFVWEGDPGVRWRLSIVETGEVFESPDQARLLQALARSADPRHAADPTEPLTIRLQVRAPGE